MYQGMMVCCDRTANTTPCRKWDWQAWIDGREEDRDLYGLGETKEEALKVLGEAIVEHVDDAIFDLAASGAIPQEIAQECFTSIDGLTYVPY